MSIILSVVIPTYNSARYLEDCLQSVAREVIPRVEFLLMDGNSSDDTMKICERYRDVLNVVLSEPDTGQSSALNKGFQRAKGRYFTWLNSDDVLLPGALKYAVTFLSNTQNPWVTANTAYIDAEGRILRYLQGGKFEGFAVRLGLLNVFGPSTFFHRDLYREIGPINEQLHYCMDTEYWWRIVASGREYIRMPIYFWALRLHDKAKTASVILSGQVPFAMAEESTQISVLYHPVKSWSALKLAIFMARIYRMVTLTTFFSWIDTYKKRGKQLGDI